MVSRKWIATVVTAEESSTQVQLLFAEALDAEGLVAGPDPGPGHPPLLAMSDNGGPMISHVTREFFAMLAIAQRLGPHPVTASVPIPFAALTLENAEATLRFVFDMLVWCTSSPRPRRPRPFREWCDRQQESLAPLLDLWTDIDMT